MINFTVKINDEWVEMLINPNQVTHACYRENKKIEITLTSLVAEDSEYFLLTPDIVDGDIDLLWQDIKREMKN